METHFGLEPKLLHAQDFSTTDDRALRIFLAIVADCFPPEVKAKDECCCYFCLLLFVVVCCLLFVVCCLLFVVCCLLLCVKFSLSKKPSAPAIEKSPPKIITPSRISEKKVAVAEPIPDLTPPKSAAPPGRLSDRKPSPGSESTVAYVAAHGQSGGAYAKPAQSAAARAKDLKRRSTNAKNRGSSSQSSSVIEEGEPDKAEN